MFKRFVDTAIKRNSVMLISKRERASTRRTMKNLPHHYFQKFSNYCKLIKKFGLDNCTARRILFDNHYVFDQPEQQIVGLIDVCNKWKIDTSTLPLNVKMLTLSPETVENRIMMLEEMGISDIHAGLLLRPYGVCGPEVSVRMFMALAKVPESEDIGEKIIKHLGPVPSDAPPLGPLCNKLPMGEYRSRLLQWYLSWRLNDPENCPKATKRLKERSVRILRERVKLFHDEIGITGRALLLNLSREKATVEELRRILEEVETFGGVSLKRLIRVNPHLHKMRYDNVIRVVDLVRKHGFTDEMMRCCPEVLVMPHELFGESIDFANATPELRVLQKNKKFLFMLCHINIVKARLAYFRHNNFRNITVRTLCGHRRMDSIQRTGVDHTSGREIGISLEQYLRVPAREITRRIKEHPHWRQIDILSINVTAKYLLEQFSPEDVWSSVHLVLYDKEKIAKTLQSLPELNPGLSKARSDKDILAICLYEIEREVHFTGDGVWRYQAPLPKLEFHREHIEAELSDVSDSEIAEEPTRLVKRKYVQKKDSINA